MSVSPAAKSQVKSTHSPDRVTGGHRPSKRNFKVLEVLYSEQSSRASRGRCRLETFVIVPATAYWSAANAQLAVPDGPCRNPI
jgi:hypothetical protein